jgi:matrixin
MANRSTTPGVTAIIALLLTISANRIQSQEPPPRKDENGKLSQEITPPESVSKRASAGTSRINPMASKEVRYFVDETVTEIPSIGRKGSLMIAEAFAAWAAVSDINFKNTANLADADFRLVVSDLNGPPPPFAVSDVGPPNGTRTLELRLNKDTQWEPELFEHIMTHEIGHLLGLTHTSVPRQLMNDVLQPNIKTPQNDDIKRLREIWSGKGPNQVDESRTGPTAVAEIFTAQQERQSERERETRKENVSLAQWLGPWVLVFTFLIVLVEAGIMVLRRQSWEDGTFKLIGLTLIVNAGVFLTVSIVDRELMSPMFGLMGALAGYILGRDASVNAVRTVQQSPAPAAIATAPAAPAPAPAAAPP